MACVKCEDGFLTRDSGELSPCRPCHRRAKRVQEYAEELVSWMGLADWTITVTTEEVEDGSMAEIECIYGQRLARVSLSPQWDEFDLPTQRDTLVHELVHAILAPLTQMAYDMIDALNVEGQGPMVAKASMGNVEEWVVDNIAIAWGQHLPLPKEYR
jgi:hypothetical protein